MVDFHSHILPGADHGSRNVETSLAQIKLAQDCGVGRIIATPHFYAHRMSVQEFLKLRTEAYLRLLPHIDSSIIRLAAEVLICDNIQNLPGIEQLCIYGTNMLLLELPFNDFDKSYKYVVTDLKTKGIDVILAHADRYQPENIEVMLSAGAKIQLNADALDVFFKKRHLYDWMERGLVVALGSDIHGEDKNAYKHFIQAMKKMGKHLPFVENCSNEIWDKSSIYPV